MNFIETTQNPSVEKILHRQDMHIWWGNKRGRHRTYMSHCDPECVILFFLFSWYVCVYVCMQQILGDVVCRHTGQLDWF